MYSCLHVSDMAQTAVQVADLLYGTISHAVSWERLNEYGIEATEEQAQQITRQILSLNLYWIRSALGANLSRKDAERVDRALQARIDTEWESGFGLGEQDRRSFWAEAQESARAYDQVMQEGGSPVSVAMDAAMTLESIRAVNPDDRQKLLALLIDVVPVETFGEMAAEFEMSEG